MRVCVWVFEYVYVFFIFSRDGVNQPISLWDICHHPFFYSMLPYEVILHASVAVSVFIPQLFICLFFLGLFAQSTHCWQTAFVSFLLGFVFIFCVIIIIWDFSRFLIQFCSTVWSHYCMDMCGIYNKSCVFEFLYMCICAFLFTSICVNMYVCIKVCVVCVCLYICMFICVYVSVCMCLRLFVCVCKCMCLLETISCLTFFRNILFSSLVGKICFPRKKNFDCIFLAETFFSRNIFWPNMFVKICFSRKIFC